MKKIITISIYLFWTVVTIVLLANLVMEQKDNSSIVQSLPQENPTNTFSSISSDNTGSSTPETTPAIVLSTTEISKHNIPGNCWIIVSNKIYNVTSYLNSHPGGTSAIIPYCGKDATEIYSPIHSSYARDLLKNYYLGDIDQKIQTASASSSAIPSPDTSSPVPPQTINPIPNTTPTSKPTPTNPPTSAPKTTLSLSEISKHNSTGNCWIIISNKVYNVTSYLTLHPAGASAIVPSCGKDATTVFTSNVPKTVSNAHSSYAWNLLAAYYIGDVNQQIQATSSPATSITPNTPQNPTPTPYIPPPKRDREEEDDD